MSYEEGKEQKTQMLHSQHQGHSLSSIVFVLIQKYACMLFPGHTICTTADTEL